MSIPHSGLGAGGGGAVGITEQVDPERLLVPLLGRAAPSGRGGAAATVLRLGTRIGLPLAVAGVIIGLWYAVSDIVLNSYQRFMLPPPHRVVEVGFFTWSNFVPLVQALGTTAQVTFTGLAISIVAGVGTAVAMSQAKWVENALYPWMVVLQTIPILALTPFLSFFFGFALTPRVIVAVIIAFFPIVSNTLFGLQSADAGMHDLFALHKANRWTRLWKLQFPAALPAMFAGLRVSAGLAVIGAIVGEFFFKQGQAGLGTNMSVYTSLTEGEQLWASVLTASGLGIAVFVFFGWLSRRVVGRWYQPQRR
ncbi:MAG TPA: ABC transporter permease [Trebonia sp.]|nr:ABC transporter permease [Trebonia sp.]